MTFENFESTLSDSNPPAGIDKLLEAMWLDANDKWDAAHQIAQSVYISDGSWVHAYLHRKEGDLSNSAYWYSRAGRTMPGISLQEEWKIIVKALLSD